MSVDITRVVDELARNMRVMEEQAVRELRRYIEEAERRLQDRLRTRYQAALRDVRAGELDGRVYREARARALLAELEAAIDTLDLGSAQTGVPDLLRNAIEQSHAEGFRQAHQVLERFNLGAAQAATQINFTAIRHQVENGIARLHRYHAPTVEKINQAVIDGLVQGRGYRQVHYDVRTALMGDPRAKPLYRTGYDAIGRRRHDLLVQGRGGLAFQAETIARTEMISSLESARQQATRDAGFDLLMWVATEDDRTCSWCAARDGQVYALDDVVLPAHPRCRCATTPVRREWLEDGSIDVEAVQKHRDETIAAYRKVHGDDARFATGPTPFEKAQGLKAKPEPVWTPGTGFQ